ncbi:AAA family ATPase, partial [Actinoplanes sp. TRM 88003]
MPSDLRVWLLGGFRVEVAGQSVPDGEWRRSGATALVKLLALRGRLHRDEAVDLLWPEADQALGVRRLNKSLHFARRVLGTDRIELRDGLLVLNTSGLWTDVDAFDRASDQGDGQAALELYTGDLLPGNIFDDWTEPRRAQLRNAVVQLLLERAAHARPHQAETDLVRLTTLDPLHEEAYARLMRLEIARGQRHSALRWYDRLVVQLREELGVEPRADLQQMHHELTAAAGPAALSPAPAPGPRSKLGDHHNLTVPKSRPADHQDLAAPKSRLPDHHDLAAPKSQLADQHDLAAPKSQPADQHDLAAPKSGIADHQIIAAQRSGLPDHHDLTAPKLRLPDYHDLAVPRSELADQQSIANSGSGLADHHGVVAQAPGFTDRYSNEERKLVTVLDADLRGIRGQAADADPERARREMVAWTELLREVITRWGGAVQPLVGGGVIGVFGYPTAREDHADRALWAGSEILRRSPVPIALGADTGQIIVASELAGIGGAVLDTAARLRAAAAPRTLLVTDRTRQAALRPEFQFGDRTPVGNPPLAARRLLTAPVADAQGPTPMPGATSAAVRWNAETPMVGRANEMRAVLGLIDEAVSSRRPRLITITGVAGIGKTRLVREVLAQTEAAPSPADKTAAPPPDNKTAAPRPGEKTAAPPHDNKTVTPPPDDKTAATPPYNTAAPPDENTTAPPHDNKTVTPPPDDKTAATPPYNT